MTVAANLSAETSASLEHDPCSVYVFGTNSPGNCQVDLLTTALCLSLVASLSPLPARGAPQWRGKATAMRGITFKQLINSSQQLHAEADRMSTDMVMKKTTKHNQLETSRTAVLLVLPCSVTAVPPAGRSLYLEPQGSETKYNPTREVMTARRTCSSWAGSWRQAADWVLKGRDNVHCRRVCSGL